MVNGVISTCFVSDIHPLLIVEIFLNRRHQFDMLDRRFMRPTPGYLTHIPPIYTILVAAAHSFAVESTATMPLCYQLHMLCGGRDENHHHYCGSHKSIIADYGEPPIEPSNSAAKTGLVSLLLLRNDDI